MGVVVVEVDRFVCVRTAVVIVDVCTSLNDEWEKATEFACKLIISSGWKGV